jgi:hypothetical protein
MSEKLTKNFVYSCHRESCWSNLVFCVYAHLIYFVPASESRKACRIQVELLLAVRKQAIPPLRSEWRRIEQESNDCQ